MRKRTWLKRIITAVLAGMMLTAAGAAGAEISYNNKVRFTYSAAGKMETVTFLTREENPTVPGDKGYATERFTWGKNGELLKTELLDVNGNLVNGRDGYAYRTETYNRKLLTESAYFNAAGEPANGPEGWARKVYEYSKAQKLTGVRTYGADGKAVGLRRELTYTRAGLPESEAWYDAEDKPAEGPDGWAKLAYTYEGKITSVIAYTGADGKPCFFGEAGYATRVTEVERGRAKKVYFLGADGEPIAGPDGWAWAELSVKNNLETEMYFAADGTPFRTERGIVGRSYRDGPGYLAAEEILYTEPGVRGYGAEGYSRVVRTFAKNGMISSQKFYDDQNKLMVVPALGYAEERHSFRNGVIETEATYYGTNGKLTVNADGFAAVKYTYDKANRLTEAVYLGADGKKPVNTAAGFARIRYERDARGNITSEKELTAEGEACPNDEGTDEVRFAWTEEGLMTSRSYWNGGEAATGTSGCHEVRYMYNAYGLPIRETFFDTAGNTTTGPEGYGAKELEYNSRGGLISERYYDKNWLLLQAEGKEYAFTRTIPFEDLRFTECEPDPDNLPAANGVLVEYHGLDSKIMTLAAGYAYYTESRDGEGRPAARQWYHADGTPAAGPDSYAGVEWEYDDEGRLRSESYYGETMAPVRCAAGYHRIEWEWNGDSCTERLYDEDRVLIGERLADETNIAAPAWQETAD